MLRATYPISTDQARRLGHRITAPISNVHSTALVILALEDMDAARRQDCATRPRPRIALRDNVIIPLHQTMAGIQGRDSYAGGWTS